MCVTQRLVASYKMHLVWFESEGLGSVSRSQGRLMLTPKSRRMASAPQTCLALPGPRLGSPAWCQDVWVSAQFIPQCGV